MVLSAVLLPFYFQVSSVSNILSRDKFGTYRFDAVGILPTTARPGVASRTIHNEETFFQYSPNINFLTGTSHQLPWAAAYSERLYTTVE
jgi:hypothetical protein